VQSFFCCLRLKRVGQKYTCFRKSLRPTPLAAFIVGSCILIGLSAGGYLVGKGLSRFKSDVRTVTVKGLVEKTVKSEQAVWVLRLRRASQNLKEAHDMISADRQAVIAFLKDQGFDEDEMSLGMIKGTKNRKVKVYHRASL
jgi:hypothetical protein